MVLPPGPAIAPIRRRSKVNNLRPAQTKRLVSGEELEPPTPGLLIPFENKYHSLADCVCLRCASRKIMGTCFNAQCTPCRRWRSQKIPAISDLLLGLRGRAVLSKHPNLIYGLWVNRGRRSATHVTRAFPPAGLAEHNSTSRSTMSEEAVRSRRWQKKRKCGELPLPLPREYLAIIFGSVPAGSVATAR